MDFGGREPGFGIPAVFRIEWQVPVGTLQEGVTYYAWVLTDWVQNKGHYDGTGPPETVPPFTWGVPFTLKLGLGDSPDFKAMVGWSFKPH